MSAGDEAPHGPRRGGYDWRRGQRGTERTPARARAIAAVAGRRRRAPALAVGARRRLRRGLVAGALHAREQAFAERFAAAWQRGDYAAMYAQLTPAPQAATAAAVPARLPRRRADRDAATAVALGRAARAGATATACRSRVNTRVFGPVRGTVALPVARRGRRRASTGPPTSSSPGCARARSSARTTRLPPRAALLRTRQHGAGRGRRPHLARPAVAAAVVGQLGADPARARRRAEAPGRARPTRQVGISGLERVFDDAAARAARRRAARRPARPQGRPAEAAARDVRTTISTPVQQAAAVRAGRAPRRRRRAATRAPARCWRSPGSRSRASAPGLDVQDHHRDRRAGGQAHQPVAHVSRADQGDAGGRGRSRTPTASRAAARWSTPSRESCNSVFAPLGAQLGAQRLVDVARALRLQPAGGHPRRRARARSRRPTRSATTSRSARPRSGRAACRRPRCRWRVVGGDDRPARPAPAAHARPRHAAARPQTTRATTPAVARTMERLMRAVVRYGTGKRAAIPGVAVAGKTGTAELRSTQALPA